MSRLVVVADGRTLPEQEARPIWERFSAYMEAHHGDFDGFAQSEGYASARVAVRDGRPTLTLTKQNA